MAGQNPVMFDIGGPGYGIPGANKNDPDTATPTMTPYKIPPVVWVIVFLVAGYIGVRSIMEG